MRDYGEGECLGRVSGKVLFSSESMDVAEDWGLELADDRVLLLRHGVGWAVVDTRGWSVFEFANCSSSEQTANVHVSLGGWVTCVCDICKGDELVWWYGEMHAAALGIE